MVKLLNVTHRINGIAESLVKKVSEMIKIYANDDTEIEGAIPVIEMALRSTVSTLINLSLFRICCGIETSVAVPYKITEKSSFSADYKLYFEWLADDLQISEEAMRKNRVEI